MPHRFQAVTDTGARSPVLPIQQLAGRWAANAVKSCREATVWYQHVGGNGHKLDMEVVERYEMVTVAERQRLGS
jgi:hypothetical protein